MKKRSNLTVMMRLIGLVKPLTGYMILAVLLGVIGFLCAIFITIFGGWALLDALHMESPVPMAAAFAIAISIAVARGFLRYGEQACNHYIAFKLLALIRDHVFKALRKLCPAKLEGKGKGNLISVITSDIELLEVFYAHTISPILIAFSVSVIMVGFIMSIHWVLGLVALAAYLVVGVAVPMIVSKMSGDTGNQFREQSGSLSSFVLDSLRGLSESIQYQTGKKRLEELDSRTDSLTKEEEKQKKYMGRNMAITNTIILIFSLLMLTAASLLYVNNMIGFEGLLISVIAMMSSFGPVVALANLGLNVILVQYIGLFGILLSTILTMIFIGMPWLIYNLFTVIFKRSAFEFTIKMLMYTVLVCAMCVITYIVCSQITLSGITGFVVKGIVVFGIANILFVLATFFTSEYRQTKELILKIMKRKF